MFEFYPAKCILNKDKHGIDFTEATALWNDPGAIEIPAATLEEARYLVIGLINGKYWTVVATNRGERIRIISARHSRKSEVTLYEKHNSEGV